MLPFFLKNLGKSFSKPTALIKKASGNIITNNANEENALPDISASVSGTLTSYNLVILISALSSVLAATYSWKGPFGFTSKQQNIFITEPGTYTVTVTDPANGCSSSASVVVDREPEPSINKTHHHSNLV
jgi:hypothetical protein